MVRLYYASNCPIDGPILGYVLAFECEEFYVIQKTAYERACKKLGGKRKPKFKTDKPVYIDGVNI